LPEWTHHGGRLSHAIAAFPQVTEPWLDLSTGINPDPWDGVDGLVIDWQRLPDEADLARLEQVATAHFGVRGHGVLALPGTELGLRGLSMLGLPPPFRHVAPGYRTHGKAFVDSRAIDFGALEEQAELGGTILLANPANPDGRLLAVAELAILAQRLAAKGGWLVVDEAFIDAHEDASILSALDVDAPVIVLRSFGKFFGLAGVRLGFAVGPQALIAQWRAMLGSWPVSAAAIAIGTAAYGDAAWSAATRLQLVERAAALDTVLVRHGLTPIGQSPLFRLVECDAARLFDQLARRGILTRPFDYAPRWLRLGIPADAQQRDRLDQALADG
jgi:cobalamin biosynthetic protein CobC